MEERKKLKFVCHLYPNQPETIEMIRQCPEKMAEHLCHITYLNDCLKWVAVTVQDIIPSV